MKKSIICSLILMFAFTVCAFCEENAVKQTSQKNSIAATTVAKETKSAVDTVKKDVATAEKKVSADAAKISADAKSTINDAKKTVETAEEKAITEAKSAADTAKTAAAATEEKIAAETKSAVDGAKKDMAATEEKIANDVAKASSETESVANAAKKDVETAEQKAVTETKSAINDVEKDVAKVEENKTQVEDEVTKETPKAVKEAPAKAVAKDNSVAETSSEKKKIFNYSKDKSRTEIEIKVGRTVNAKPEIARESVDVDDVYTLGIEVVAYSNSFIGFGAGIYNVFDSKIKKDGVTITDPRPEGNNGEYKIAFTNPYLTLKSKILQFDSDIIRNVYIFGQIGYGFMRIENAYETEDGMYWGVGGGIDIWHFLIDVNYATNFGKIKRNHGEKKVDVRQSTIIVSLGYRFSL